MINDAELTGSVNTVLLDKDKTYRRKYDIFGLQAAYLKEIDNSSNKKTLTWGWRPPSTFISKVRNTGCFNYQ